MIVNIKANLENAIEDIVQLATSEGEPRWSVNIRKAGLVSARTMPDIDPKNEAWRRTPARFFFPDRQQPINLVGEKMVVNEFQTVSEDEAALHAYGINSRSEAKDSAQAEALTHGNYDSINKDGVQILPMGQALKQVKGLNDFFFEAECHQKDLSCALNAALRTGGAYVEIAPGAAPARAFHILHDIKQDPSSADQSAQPLHFSHSLIRASERAHAVVVESFQSQAGEALKAHSLIEFDISSGAQVNYILVSDWAKEAACLTTIHARMGQDASLKIIFAGIGAGLAKTFFSEDLNSPGSNAEIYGVVFTDNTARSDVDTYIHHKAPHSTSNVLFNCAVAGNSRSIFAGNIYVDGQAQKTDAYQKNQNLLLSPQARAESMPKLEIIADDVRCTHGASFTNYDENQLFYLQSRGLNEVEAKSLIISGFFREVVERSDDQAVANWLFVLTQSRFIHSNAS